MLKAIYDKQCNQCLFSKDKIVSDERKKEIIDKCLKQDKYFICHKATIDSEDVACSGFYKRYKNDVTLLRLISSLKDKARWFKPHKAKDLVKNNNLGG